MITMVRRTLAQRARGDEGVALIVSISLVGIVAILVLALVAVALSEARASGRDRQRSVAVQSAEGKVDALLATVQSADPATLPCGDLATQNQTVMSDQLAVDAVVTYYDAAGTEVDCAAVTSGAAVAQASISATSTSGAIVGTSPAERTVETLIRLTPTYGNSLDKAIYGEKGVTIENNGTIVTADGQPNADVYTNGDFECDGNQEYMGSIHAQGHIDITNSCTVAVDVHAGKSVDANHAQATVNGNARAAGGTLVFKGHLGQRGYATGNVSGTGCNGGKCTGNTSVPMPPVSTFPVLKWDAATQSAWASEGHFTNVVTFSGTQCKAPTGNGDKDDAVGEWIKNNASSLPANTVVVANCPGVQVFQSGIDLSLNRSLAVFPTAGIKIDGNPTIKSSTGGQQRLYLVQPHGVTCNPTTGIYLGNNVSFLQTVDVMLYSPCDIDKRNQSDIFGQIYSGGFANLSNKTDMTFKQLPLFGVTSTSSTVAHYDVEVLYKRENR